MRLQATLRPICRRLRLWCVCPANVRVEAEDEKGSPFEQLPDCTICVAFERSALMFLGLLRPVSCLLLHPLMR